MALQESGGWDAEWEAVESNFFEAYARIEALLPLAERLPTNAGTGCVLEGRLGTYSRVFRIVSSTRRRGGESGFQFVARHADGLLRQLVAQHIERDMALLPSGGPTEAASACKVLALAATLGRRYVLVSRYLRVAFLQLDHEAARLQLRDDGTPVLTLDQRFLAHLAPVFERHQFVERFCRALRVLFTTADFLQHTSEEGEEPLPLISGGCAIPARCALWKGVPQQRRQDARCGLAFLHSTLGRGFRDSVDEAAQAHGCSGLSPQASCALSFQLLVEDIKTELVVRVGETRAQSAARSACHHAAELGADGSDVCCVLHFLRCVALHWRAEIAAVFPAESPELSTCGEHLFGRAMDLLGSLVWELPINQLALPVVVENSIAMMVTGPAPAVEAVASPAARAVAELLPLVEHCDESRGRLAALVRAVAERCLHEKLAAALDRVGCTDFVAVASHLLCLRSRVLSTDALVQHSAPHTAAVLGTTASRAVETFFAAHFEAVGALARALAHWLEQRHAASGVNEGAPLRVTELCDLCVACPEKDALVSALASHLTLRLLSPARPTAASALSSGGVLTDDEVELLEALQRRLGNATCAPLAAIARDFTQGCTGAFVMRTASDPVRGPAGEEGGSPRPIPLTTMVALGKALWFPHLSRWGRASVETAAAAAGQPVIEALFGCAARELMAQYAAKHPRRRLSWLLSAGSVTISWGGCAPLAAHTNRPLEVLMPTVVALALWPWESTSVDELAVSEVCRQIGESVPIELITAALATLTNAGLLAKCGLETYKPAVAAPAAAPSRKHQRKMVLRLPASCVVSFIGEGGGKELQAARHTDRRVRTEAAIVRVLKSCRVVCHADLAAAVTRQVAHQFPLDEQLLRTAVGDLISKDYMRRDDDDPEVYLYTA